MNILDKYFLRLIIKSSFATLVGLVLIFAFFQFIGELNEVTDTKYTIGIALNHILFLIPSYISSLLVLSLLIGTVFSIGQLNSNKELQIYQTATISTPALIKKAIKYPVVVAIILLGFLEFITPQTLDTANQIKAQALGKLVFQDNNDAWFKKDDQILFLRKDKTSNYFINIFETQDNNLLSFTHGDGAYFSDSGIVSGNSKKIKFIKEKRFEAPEESFQEIDILFDLSSEEIGSLSKNIKTMTLYDITKLIASTVHHDFNINHLVVEFLSRILKPVSLIGMILLAIPFTLDLSRNISIGNRIFIAVSIGTVSHLFTKILSMVSLKFESMLIVGSILPTVTMIILGLLLIKLKLRY